MNFDKQNLANNQGANLWKKWRAGRYGNKIFLCLIYHYQRALVLYFQKWNTFCDDLISYNSSFDLPKLNCENCESFGQKEQELILEFISDKKVTVWDRSIII